MEQLTHDRLRRSLQAALRAGDHSTDALSQLTFLEQFTSEQPWMLGPFERMPALDYLPTGQWDDPDGIGWTATSLINPTIIARGDELHLFSRASPRKESLASRIGHAVYTDETGWRDAVGNPVIRPTLNNELLGTEDPKVYRAEGRWHLFYNGVFPVMEEDRRRYPSVGYTVDAVGCDINLAVSDDLTMWTKLGSVAPHEVTRLWAKGAVIPRDLDGNAVRIDGRYLMYLSEGCDGVPHVGESDDLLTWRFRPQPYLDLQPLDGRLHEVATAVVRDDSLVLDFFYSARGRWSAGQARYDLHDPFRQTAIAPGGTLAWGGFCAWQGRPVFAQGWDSPDGIRALQFFRLAESVPEREARQG